MNKTSWWWVSAAVSAVLIVVLVSLWMKMNKQEVDPSQLATEEDVTAYLDKLWDEPSEMEQITKIKTGIFIQSLQFSSSTDVQLTGYIWQHYKDRQLELLGQDPNEVGFILPEQVNTGMEPKEVYRVRKEDGEVVGWYFEATLRQPFDYKDYPFDHKTIWVRMWPKGLRHRVILVPDFDAYKTTGHTDIFGIEENIVLGSWVRENTYFDFKLANYNTNFGLSDTLWKVALPELHYNFVVKRKFETAFIVYLLPLFLVAALLFAALLTVSENEKFSRRLGFSTSGFIGASSALFFVVMLGHIQLRQQFAGISPVYIEYFYMLMYGVLVFATANTYLFSIRAQVFGGLLLYKDNLIPKVAYWPLLIGSSIIITLFFM